MSGVVIQKLRKRTVLLVMLLLIYHCYCPLTVDFLVENVTLNSDRHVLTLKKLKSDIPNKRRRTGACPVILHHDSARPHASSKTLEAIDKLKWESPTTPTLLTGLGTS